MRKKAAGRLSVGLLLLAAADASVAGCVGDDPGVSPRDASTESGAISDDGGRDALIDGPVDAGVDGPLRCDPNKPFGPPVSLGLRSYGRLSADELTLYFSQNLDGDAGVFNYEIFVVSRANPSAPFGTPSLLTGNVNTSESESHPSVTQDLRTLYYGAFVGAIGAIGAIHFASRSNDQAPWAAGGPIAALNSGSDERYPYVLPGHSAIYFSSQRSGGGDLYRATGPGPAFGAPQLVPGVGVNTPSNEFSPVVTPDELTLYFASDRGADGGPRKDIYVARRTSAAADFGPPAPVVELNAGTQQLPTWVSADGCVLYLSQQDAMAGIPYYIKVAARPK